jgi:RND family efflux transporter MFP subunit
VGDSERQVPVAAAERAAAEARVTAARAARDQAAATLAKTDVRAPFDGIVVLKDAEVGEVVSPNSQGGSNARGSVCTMVDFASLEVQADVPETSIAAVRLGAPAQVFLDAYPDRAYAARVDRIWPTANRQKATIEVRIAFAAPDERLRPDMGVRVVFAAGGGDAQAAAAGPAILVPESAVVEVDGKPATFVVEQDTVRLQAVQLGERSAGRVVVREGLRSGQRIAVDPPPSLRGGERIRVEQNP